MIIRKLQLQNVLQLLPVPRPPSPLAPPTVCTDYTMYTSDFQSPWQPTPHMDAGSHDNVTLEVQSLDLLHSRSPSPGPELHGGGVSPHPSHPTFVIPHSNPLHSSVNVPTILQPAKDMDLISSPLLLNVPGPSHQDTAPAANGWAEPVNNNKNNQSQLPDNDESALSPNPLHLNPTPLSVHVSDPTPLNDSDPAPLNISDCSSISSSQFGAVISAAQSTTLSCEDHLTSCDEQLTFSGDSVLNSTEEKEKCVTNELMIYNYCNDVYSLPLVG